MKLPTHWTSQIPKRYKRNAINIDLYRAKRIATDFQNELQLIREKFGRAKFPPKFTESVINDFHKRQIDTDDEFIIPPEFFDLPKPFILIRIVLNEVSSKRFLTKFH